MWPLITSVFVASLLGSLHCAGMCGAFVAFAVGIDDPDAARKRARLHAAYNLGRLVTYSVLGAIAGAIGGALDLAGGQFLLLLLSAVIGIALGHVFYYISIARLGVAVSSGVIQLQPFLVAMASFAVFGERLGPLQWAFGVVAVGGAGAILVSQHRLTRISRAERAGTARVQFEDLPVDAVAAFGDRHDPDDPAPDAR